MQRFLMLLFVIPLLVFFVQACHPKKETITTQPTVNDPRISQELGALFLAKNKLKANIYILPSGLQYSIIKNGIGDHPTANDLVTVYYQGRFVDGHVFDSHHYQDAPVTVRVSSLIPGWQQAITLMRSGSIWVLYIPPNLAFGEKGIPGIIGPNETLVFTVHLLGFKKP